MSGSVDLLGRECSGKSVLNNKALKMTAREKLEERVDDCQTGEEYVEVATEIVCVLDDQIWAAEVLKNGAKWAVTAKEILGFVDCALRVLNNVELGTRFMTCARELCHTPVELIRLAETAFAAGDHAAGRQLYLAATEKCATGAEIFVLGNLVGKQHGDQVLAGEIMAAAKGRCQKTPEYTELAAAVLAQTGDPEQVQSFLEAGRRACETVDDYQALVDAVRTLMGDHAMALTLIVETAATLKKSEDLTAMADYCIRELREPATAALLYKAAAEYVVFDEELIDLAKTVMETIRDRELSLQIYRQAARRLRGHRALMRLARSVLAVTGETTLADLWLRQAGDEAENSEQLVAVAMALDQQAGNRNAACVYLRKAEGVAATMDAFATVAQTILTMVDEPDWRVSLESQLAKREQWKDAYTDFMKQEQECTTCACFINLASTVHGLTGDSDYCRRLYAKAQQQAAFFEELLAVAEGIALHVGDVDWVSDLCRQLLDRRSDLVSVNAVVALMTAHLPDGRRRSDELYRAMEEQCESSGCFIRLAISVLALLGDKDRCRELYRAADQAADTQAELIILARSIEKKL